MNRTYLFSSKINLIIISLTILLLINPFSIAKSNYNNLPKLDGKIDSHTSNPTLTDYNKYTNDSTPQNIDNNQLQEPSNPTNNKESLSNLDTISTHNSSTKTTKKDYKPANSPTPKLDIMTSAVSSLPPSDNLNFTRFFNDITPLMQDFKDLKNLISNGTTLQLFSAKATTIVFRSKSFLNKYKDGTFSSFESYKLIKNIIDNSIYTKEIWFNTNQIKTNQHSIPDKILQTKFLQITTDIDKLDQLIKVHDQLSNE